MADVYRALLGALESCVSVITAKSVLTSALRRIGLAAETVTANDIPDVIVEIERGLRFFRVPAADMQASVALMQRLRRSIEPAAPPPQSVECGTGIRCEDDIVKARSRVRDLARSLGFSTVDQVKVATVVSELARNIVSYVGLGTVEARALKGPRKGIEIVARDRGTGIKNLREILSGAYVSKTGMGLGLVGCQRLMDDFSVISDSSGTSVTVRKHL